MERKRGIYEKHSKIEETWGESSSSRLPKFGPAVWAIDEHRVFTRCPPPENPLPTARASIEHRLRKPWTGAVAPDNWIRGRE